MSCARKISDSTLLSGLSETQKRELLSKPWNGYDDFNPNRILTATWKKDTGKWYGYDGVTPIDQPLNDPANTSTRFTLPKSMHFQPVRNVRAGARESRIYCRSSQESSHQFH